MQELLKPIVSGFAWDEPAMLHPQRPLYDRAIFSRIAFQDGGGDNRRRGRHQPAAPNGESSLRPVEEIAQARLSRRDRRYSDRGDRPLDRLDDRSGTRRASGALRPPQLARSGELQFERRGTPHVRDGDTVPKKSGVQAIDTVGERNRGHAVCRRHRALFPLQSGVRIPRERHGEFEQVFIIPYTRATNDSSLVPAGPHPAPLRQGWDESFGERPRSIHRLTSAQSHVAGLAGVALPLNGVAGTGVAPAGQGCAMSWMVTNW